MVKMAAEVRATSPEALKSGGKLRPRIRPEPVAMLSSAAHNGVHLPTAKCTNP
jgi:hypothetical protein